MLRILDTNGFAQISKGFWVVQIEFCACVIRDNPRENGILRQIVESPSGNGIELHLRLNEEIRDFHKGEIDTYHSALIEI